METHFGREIHIQRHQKPVKVVVTGAAGQVSYSLLYMIATGDIFGKHQPIVLTLQDAKRNATFLGELIKELVDCGMPLLLDIIATCDEQVAFTDVDAAFLLASARRRRGMKRQDLLTSNVRIVKRHAKALNQYAKNTCKILVVSNPANTNAFICSKYAPLIPLKNISSLTRLDQNRAQAQIAVRCGVSTSDVNNVLTWGNHSPTQYPDASHATVRKDGTLFSAYEAVNDINWLHNDFIKIVQHRGEAVIAARKLSSGFSAAKACADHMRDWWHGTTPGKYACMAVASDGSYGVPHGLFFSFPTSVVNGEWEIVQGLPIGDFAKEKIGIAISELEEERDRALAVCKENS